MLEFTLIKASSRMQSERKIDPLDTIYKCFNSVKITQQPKKSKDRSSENKVRRELTKELDNLNKIVKPNRATKRQLLKLRSKGEGYILLFHISQILVIRK